MSEREEARIRLQESVDQLGEQASLHARMQREPLKMLGVASGVGAVIGLLLGRSLSKTRKIYVDDTLSKKDQKAFSKAQARHKGATGGISGAILATAGTFAFRFLQERYLAPKLAELTEKLLSKAEASQPGAGKAASKPKTLKAPQTSGSEPGKPRADTPKASTPRAKTPKADKSRASKDVVVRDFRAPSEQAHADPQGNLNVTRAQQTAGQVAFAARDVPVRDFRLPSEKAHADQYGTVLPLPPAARAEAAPETTPETPKTVLEKK
ncbi:hypothetical protein [Deinococcus sp.]|uniref:hypothetical protein n=1 Tax=Deinococcus sp. TaxID=47478 RepID=UPI0025E9CDA3|nr:hypothetical protein [Deinococcus sp.]